MSRVDRVRHEFVEFIPASLDEGVVYVSISFATAVHRCCCGCGGEVVTPLAPTDWALVFDGVAISLKPSIGSWGLPCQSHYWIVRNRIRWSRPWSRAEIDSARDNDRRRKATYFKGGEERPGDHRDYYSQHIEHLGGSDYGEVKQGTERSRGTYPDTERDEVHGQRGGETPAAHPPDHAGASNRKGTTGG